MRTSEGKSGKERTLTAEAVWAALRRCSFAVVCHTTPGGAPRSSGVVYALVDRTMYVVVAADSWKARHMAVDGRVAVTVPVRRGGILSLLLPIPPATISFPGRAQVRPVESGELPEQLARLIPPSRRTSASIVEIRAEGHFVTYGIGLSLWRMRDTGRARMRVAVGGPADG